MGGGRYASENPAGAVALENQARVRAGTGLGLGIAALGCVLIWLAARLWLYSFNRFVADDFCWARVAAESGFWGAQEVFRQRWTGRYSEVFACVIASRLGPGGAIWISGAVFICVISGWAWAARGLIQTLGGWAGVAILALLVIESGLDSFQDYYWLTGALTYAAPMALIYFQAGFIIHARRADPAPRRRGIARAALIFLLAFVTAGFVETATILLGAGYCALVFLGALSDDASPAARARPLSRAGLAGALTGAVWMLSAPGISVRMIEAPDPPGLLGAWGMASAHMTRFLAEFIPARWPVLAGAVGVGFFFTGSSPRDRLGWGALRIVATLAALTLSFWPTAYATSVYPPYRALIFPGALLTLGVVWIAAALGGGSGSASAGRRIFLILFCAGALARTGQMIQMWPEARRFAAEWDARDQFISESKAAGASRIQIPAIGELPGLEGFGRNTWTDACIEAYYGIELQLIGDWARPVAWFPYAPDQALALRRAAARRPLTPAEGP